MNIKKLLKRSARFQEEKYADAIKNSDNIAKKVYGSALIERLSKRQPSKDGYELSSGVSGSNKAMPSPNSQKMLDTSGSDYRNSVYTKLQDGSVVDNNPQSWENTTRRPHRNGSPTESDLVSRIMYNATNGETTIDTKRGNTHTIDDDGSFFMEVENAGSKGRWTVGNFGY